MINTNTDVNIDGLKKSAETIKFKGKIPRFKADEQPIFEIRMLTSLNPSIVSKWIKNFHHLRSNCN
ncbi:hypothetical protein A0H76_940 [Hepatospora eriocheir]|uniref:Uncharacterized protein n=1 Tax=Hepatospora eriocheir TaxID=1081669 RepID=A0A1X0QHZ4_9MICR|nr:hypothetical protein A0H76_940 [Hepatospora eriocheir]